MTLTNHQIAVRAFIMMCDERSKAAGFRDDTAEHDWWKIVKEKVNRGETMTRGAVSAADLFAKVWSDMRLDPNDYQESFSKIFV